MVESKSVYQFKISLEESDPCIWRRIRVPETYTFWDLHIAIQDAMGWTNSHLHEFEIINPQTGMKAQIGIPDNMDSDRILPGWEQNIAAYFSPKNKGEHKAALYIYDFGDDWQHTIVLEEILPQAKVRYPLCTGGSQACPPENSGGVWGYEEILDTLRDPNHPYYQDIREWVGESFNPETFTPDQVIFTDPSKRLKIFFNQVM
jgi:hypothetical protein